MSCACATTGLTKVCVQISMNVSYLNRQERIEQLVAAQKQAKFGTMEHITRGNFVEQVTHAGEDVYVVVHLYKDK